MEETFQVEKENFLGEKSSPPLLPGIPAPSTSYPHRS